MAPHKPRMSAPVEYFTDEDDIIVYDVEDELESNPDYVKKDGQPLESFLTYCYQPMPLLLLQLPVDCQNSQEYFPPKSEDYYPQTVTSFACITLPANQIT
ncbi:hypothetical protein TNCV_490791 [Trichonephila clavipes]|nr:hypothetical protein TNCV_490791 [Trichonephila clavipes]